MLMHKMGPWEPTKRTTQLMKIDFPLTQSKLVYYLIGETIKSWFRTFVCFFRKTHHITETAQCWVPGDRSTILLATNFTRKCQKAQIPFIPPFLCYKTHDILILHKVDRICKELCSLYQF